MAMASSNLELLTNAAKLLEPLLGELVFVGGCATELLITDKAAAEVRPTLDVDAIVEITSYAGYETFSERLKTRISGRRKRERAALPLAAKDNRTRRYASRCEDSWIFEQLVSAGDGPR
jgi:hypothetical protein